MNESMYKYMKVGIIHFMAFPSTIKGDGPIIETIKKIALDDYFNAIEITWIKDKHVREEVKRILDTSHLTVAYGAQPRQLITGLNINDTDEKGRLEALALLKDGIDEAYELGASGFAFLSGKYDPDKIDQAYEALIKSTRELCSYAKSKGEMRIVHEVFDYDIDKMSLIGPAPLADKYAKEIKKEFNNFGLLVDLSHLPLLRETPEECIHALKDHIVHAHVGNCVVKNPDMPGYGDLHPRFGFPGSENDVEEMIRFLRALLEIGYLNTKTRPILSFEVKPFGDEDPEIVIANAKRVLNEAWALV